MSRLGASPLGDPSGWRDLQVVLALTVPAQREQYLLNGLVLEAVGGWVTLDRGEGAVPRYMTVALDQVVAAWSA